MEEEKKTKICPDCGNEVPSSRLLCPHCGYSFPALQTCPDCGEDCPIGEKVCHNCGHDFIKGGKDEEFLKKKKEEKEKEEKAEARRKEEEEIRLLDEKKAPRREKETKKAEEEAVRLRKEEKAKADAEKKKQGKKEWRARKKEFQKKNRKKRIPKKKVIIGLAVSLGTIAAVCTVISSCINANREAEEKEKARYQTALDKMNEDFANPDNFGMTPRLSEDGSTLTYGLYPQTVVNDSLTLDSLNNVNLPTKYGMSYLDGCLYMKKEVNPFSEDSSFDDKSKISSAESYWFKCEPIEWNVLCSSEGVYTLVSSCLLDSCRYAKTSNSYEQSDVRAWLNNDFYERAFLLNWDFLVKTNMGSSADSTEDSASDYVYLLSYDDYLNEDYGFFRTALYKAKSRRCKTTEWARANGAWASLEDVYFGYGRYWTRSPGPKEDYYAQAVDYNGSIGVEYVARTGFGIRPAIAIKLQSA